MQTARPTKAGRAYEDYRREVEGAATACAAKGDIPERTTENKKSGTCPQCGRWATTDSKGKTRKH